MECAAENRFPTSFNMSRCPAWKLLNDEFSVNPCEEAGNSRFACKQHGSLRAAEVGMLHNKHNTEIRAGETMLYVLRVLMSLKGHVQRDTAVSPRQVLPRLRQRVLKQMEARRSLVKQLAK